MRKKIFLLIQIFLFFGLTFPFKIAAQDFQHEAMEHKNFPPPHGPMNYNGRKMPPHKGFFSAIGVKVDEKAGFLVLSVYFNDVIDTNSINPWQIFIDEAPLPPETEFLFNKNRHMMRFEITGRENFTLKITGAKSFDGKMMRPTEIKNLSANTFVKYGRTEQKWQKF